MYRKRVIPSPRATLTGRPLTRTTETTIVSRSKSCQCLVFSRADDPARGPMQDASQYHAKICTAHATDRTNGHQPFGAHPRVIHYFRALREVGPGIAPCKRREHGSGRCGGPAVAMMFKRD